MLECSLPTNRLRCYRDAMITLKRHLHSVSRNKTICTQLCHRRSQRKRGEANSSGRESAPPLTTGNDAQFAQTPLTHLGGHKTLPTTAHSMPLIAACDIHT